jgi:hypothetical protein
VEEADGAAEGLAEETIAAAVIMAMVATVVAIPAVVAATLVVAVIPAAVVATLVAAAATLAAVLVVVAETLVVVVAVEVPTDQVPLLPGTTRRTPWAPLTSMPLAGTSQCPRVSLMHIPYRYIYI